MFCFEKLFHFMKPKIFKILFAPPWAAWRIIMKIYDTKTGNIKDLYALLEQRSKSSSADITAKVRDVITNVLENGDRALLDYCEMFDKVRPEKLVLGPDDIEAAAGKLAPDIYAIMEEAAGYKLPTTGTVLVTVRERDRQQLLPVVQGLKELNFNIVATEGTSKFLTENGIENTLVKKLSEGRPNVGDLIKNNDVQMIINTPIGREGMADDSFIKAPDILLSHPSAPTS